MRLGTRRCWVGPAGFPAVSRGAPFISAAPLVDAARIAYALRPSEFPPGMRRPFDPAGGELTMAAGSVSESEERWAIDCEAVRSSYSSRQRIWAVDNQTAHRFKPAAVKGARKMTRMSRITMGRGRVVRSHQIILTGLIVTGFPLVGNAAFDFANSATLLTSTNASIGRVRDEVRSSQGSSAPARSERRAFGKICSVDRRCSLSTGRASQSQIARRCAEKPCRSHATRAGCRC